MVKMVVKTLAAVGFAAFVAPALLAAPASAKVNSITVAGSMEYKDCSIELNSCAISVDLTGADRATPVTVKVNGSVLQVCTPVLSGGYGYCNLTWSPAANGTYTISATQGTQTKTVTANVPGHVGESVLGGSSDPGAWLSGLLTGSLG